MLLPVLKTKSAVWWVDGAHLQEGAVRNEARAGSKTTVVGARGFSSKEGAHVAKNGDENCGRGRMCTITACSCTRWSTRARTHPEHDVANAALRIEPELRGG